MKTYVSLGIGDACCIESLLTQQERNNISKLYFACRFGSIIAPLFENNPYYPNLQRCYFIDDEVGKAAMRQLDANAVNFWHFRPDFERNRQIGLQLFGLNGDVNFIDAASIFQSDRGYNNSSFLNLASLDNIDWKSLGTEPGKYILFHYPTSTRPRSDIASIEEPDWQFVEKVSREEELKVIVISDTFIIPPLSNFQVYNGSVRSIISLVNFSNRYMGCDSWCSILASKALDSNKIHIKSHKHNIQQDILVNHWQQKYFLPKTPLEISQFYKNYLG